jgi:hypothetical protein
MSRRKATPDSIPAKPALCQTCAAWQRIGESNHGHCRRAVPHPMGFPKLGATEWCLEHIPRQEG